MDRELEIQGIRNQLNNKLQKRIKELADKDPECNRLSGQIAVYNKWVESFVSKEDKREIKPESKQT
ncbi:MAG: hypothetical protein ACXADH_05105 [Candidatus Kariarchaeaceae archaeon]|jgi:hypothetical protein